MSTFKYWVRYQNGPSITNVNWNTSNSSYPSASVSSSGTTPIPQNTWIAVYDSGIDEFNAAQSLLSIQANLQSDPTVSDSENLCNAYLIMTASLLQTMSLNVSTTQSLVLSGSLTGSFVNPQWNYVSSKVVHVTQSAVQYISSSFAPRNESQQFNSFLQANTLYNFTIGTPDPTFQPQNITWTQISGPAPLWFMTSTTSSATLVASASVSGSYSVVAQQNTTNPQLLTVTQSLPNSRFVWTVLTEPSNSIVYINSSSNQGNGIYQNVSVSASVAGNYVFAVTESTQYSYAPTASVVSSSGASITLHFSDFSQSGQYTYALSAYNLCGNVISEPVQINVTGNPPTVSSSVLTILQNIPTTYSISASNSPTLYSANGLPTGSTVNTTTGLLSIAAFSGSITAGITASNSFGSGYGTLNINTAPVRVSVVFSDASAHDTVGYPNAVYSGSTVLDYGTLLSLSPTQSFQVSVDNSAYSNISLGQTYSALHQIKYKCVVGPNTYYDFDLNLRGQVTATNSSSMIYSTSSILQQATGSQGYQGSGPGRAIPISNSTLIGSSFTNSNQATTVIQYASGSVGNIIGPFPLVISGNYITGAATAYSGSIIETIFNF